jgi:hypothetical protein
VLVNGGQIAYTDVAGSLGSGRPVVVLAGSDRTADAAEARRERHDPLLAEDRVNFQWARRPGRPVPAGLPARVPG